MLWEIAAQALPWNDVPSGSFLQSRLLDLISAGQRPSVDAAWPAGYCGVMRACWATDASMRPTFVDVVSLWEEAAASTA